MKQSFVSVVLPTHNRIETLRHSLESVLAQTYSPIEIVLVDDYSNLEIKRKIEELAQEDARIRIVRNEENIEFKSFKASNSSIIVCYSLRTIHASHFTLYF